MIVIHYLQSDKKEILCDKYNDCFTQSIWTKEKYWTRIEDIGIFERERTQFGESNHTCDCGRLRFACHWKYRIFTGFIWWILVLFFPLLSSLFSLFIVFFSLHLKHISSYCVYYMHLAFECISPLYLYIIHMYVSSFSSPF
jgi:hypothetical protein